MAKMCNIDSKLSTTEIINTINRNITYFYFHRNQQNIDNFIKLEK